MHDQMMRAASLESNNIKSSYSSSSDYISGSNSPPPLLPRLLTAEEIILKSYRQTLGALSVDKLCINQDSNDVNNVDAMDCINSLLAEITELSSPNNSPRWSLESSSSSKTATSPSSSSTKSFPWWFTTMLRDYNSKNSGMRGAWHNLTISNPPMDICTIEKVATTQWRHLQCYLNENKVPLKKIPPNPCQLNKTQLLARRLQPQSSQSQQQTKRETKQQQSSGVPVSRVVMLRDPLERLLSGYLNKCVDGWRRRVEGHCEPNVIFNNNKNNNQQVKKRNNGNNRINTNEEEEEDLTYQIQNHPKQLFAAFVDAFPLKWNIHFFPMSMYCDLLFRHVDAYNFVGYMGTNFYDDLQSLGDKFGNERNNLQEGLERVFHVSTELRAASATAKEAAKNNSNKDDGRRGSNTVGKETQASNHVKEYYTASSVRRALEYFAIDYVRLNLNVPQWVHEILDEENEDFMNEK